MSQKSGESVKAARIKRGWNQAEAALKLRTYPPMLNMVERGTRPVPRAKVKLWAKVLGVSAESLIDVEATFLPKQANFCPTCGHSLRKP